MPLLLIVLLAACAPAASTTLAMPAPTDTLHLEVGSSEVDASYFVPHRARNTVYIGDATTPTTTWTTGLPR